MGKVTIPWLGLSCFLFWGFFWFVCFFLALQFWTACAILGKWCHLFQPHAFTMEHSYYSPAVWHLGKKEMRRKIRSILSQSLQSGEWHLVISCALNLHMHSPPPLSPISLTGTTFRNCTFIPGCIAKCSPSPIDSRFLLSLKPIPFSQPHRPVSSVLTVAAVY